MTNETVRAAISLEKVSKIFGKAKTEGSYVAVDKLNLQVAQGQMLALLGKTGCGKSTIFNMIAGLTEPSEGKVTVDGRDPFREFDAFRGKMAIVFPERSAVALAHRDRERRTRARNAEYAGRGAQGDRPALARDARLAWPRK